MVPRKLGRGLVLLKQVPAQGLAKCHLSQPSQSLLRSMITSRHPEVCLALELSCCLAAPPCLSSHGVSSRFPAEFLSLGSCSLHAYLFYQTPSPWRPEMVS